jgi:urease accessory protein
MQMPLQLTRLGHVLVARYLGDDPRQCMDGFAGLRARCRRLWWQLDEEMPRIWKT